jgi:hypothetical protein
VGEQVLQRRRAGGADLQDQAGVARDRVDLLHLGQLGQAHHRRRLAPARRVDVDEGQERLADEVRVEDGHRAPDRADLAQPLGPLVDRGRGQVQRRPSSA